MKSTSNQHANNVLVTAATAATALAGVWGIWQWFQKGKQTSSSRGGGASSSDVIYLDYNGTTPIYPEVLEAMMPYLIHHYGNPSSSHIMGQEPRRAINQARKDILGLLECNEQEDDDDNYLDAIWFTSCGTEADNLAIQLAIQSQPKSKPKPYHVVTSNVEHPAVELYLKRLEHQGLITVTYVPVYPSGCVHAKDMIHAMTDDTILVTLMLANNESGALQPVKEVAQVCRERGILMHTDAAQAAGKVSIALEDLGHPDLISIVGHKLGAPKGIACLYVRPQCCQEHGRHLPHGGIMVLGGGQEHGRRAGTENTPYIVGFGVAAKKAHANLSKNGPQMEQMRSRLLEQLQSKCSNVAVKANGPEDPHLRLPNTLSVGFENVHSGELLKAIGHQVAASAGATCHGACNVSSVLTAMQVPPALARGTLRLSLGPTTTAAQVDKAAQIIATAISKQKQVTFV